MKRQRDEIVCVHCGMRRAERKKLANQKTAWWLCEKCSCRFAGAKLPELVSWYRDAVEKYRETRDKAYLKFADTLLKPCIPSAVLRKLEKDFKHSSSSVTGYSFQQCVNHLSPSRNNQLSGTPSL